MIGRGEVLTAILDPFDRASKLQRGGTDQKIFRVEFTANAEAAADVTLIKLNGLRWPFQQSCDRVAIPMRHLRGAMQFEHIACLVISRDGSACFDRNAGVTPDRK